MRIGRKLTVPTPEIGVITGRLRCDRRTKDLAKRLLPGEIVLIDHEDLDRIAVEALLRAGIAGVINAKKSISGRYPNFGPLLLAAANVPLIDEVGEEAFNQLQDGQIVTLRGQDVSREGNVVVTGVAQDLASLEIEYEAAKLNLDAELGRFAENTLEYMRLERDLVVGPVALPKFKTKFDHRHVLIVVRGHDYRDDLRHLKPYVHELRPVIIGVDGGADALLELGMKPDMIVGDFDSVSDEAITSGAELVAHAYLDGQAPAAERLERLGAKFHTLQMKGTSEDVAMLLSYELGAELLVAVGTHASMVEFLEKGRSGMASTFLTRLKVGPILVDAKGVSRLYETRLRKRDFVMLLGAAAVAITAITLVSYPLRSFVSNLWSLITLGWR